MKLFLENWKRYTQVLNESSLSRVYHHMLEHDCCIVSAFRNQPLDKSKCASDSIEDYDVKLTKLSKDQQEIPKTDREINETRSTILKSILLSNKYGVTEVRGSYIENFSKPEAVEVQEKSLFVVNVNDDPNFFSKLSELGSTFCQDSILYIPKGSKGAFLYGTNRSEFPGFGNKIEVGDLKMGSESEFMTRVDKRPFSFNESVDYKEKLQLFSELNRMEKMAVQAIANGAKRKRESK